MVSAFIRRVCTFLLTLSVVAGFAAHGVQAAHMRATMAVAALEMPMPDGCDSGDDAAATACSAMCAPVMAVLPVPLAVQPAEITPPYAIVSVTGTGLHESPDPFPPRSIVLI